MLAWRSLLWLSMTWKQKYLAQNYLLSITSLTFIVLFSQEKPLRWKEINTHTYTQAVITWFKSIENKRSSSFIKFSTKDFFPSISKDLLIKSINYAKPITTIEEEVIKTVFYAGKSLLFDKISVGVKKDNSDFDGAMVSYDGAEVFHPPYIIKPIPLMISKWISDISCDSDHFYKASSDYDTALKKSVFSENIKYLPSQPKQRKRKRQIIWFKPP